MSKQSEATCRLRALLQGPDIIIMPCCFDAFSAKLIEQAGFQLTFMSGFAVSAARLGLPDTGLISYGEMVDQGRTICSSVRVPVIGDGDTGYGNALNVKRTVRGYFDAGFAGIMIEDQRSPKRCGHTQGKEVVVRREALQRFAAAVEARQEIRDLGGDLVIIARTDARATLGVEEAIERMQLFSAMGADILFIEAPESVDEMQQICGAITGCRMINMVEHGKTPMLPPEVLCELGFKIAAYPLTLLSAAGFAMQRALQCLREGKSCQDMLSFQELQQVVGFPEYDRQLKRLEKEAE
jgi:2-methylisocitrate lyase-like PEP mutase family enzyme